MKLLPEEIIFRTYKTLYKTKKIPSDIIRYILTTYITKNAIIEYYEQHTKKKLTEIINSCIKTFYGNMKINTLIPFSELSNKYNTIYYSNILRKQKELDIADYHFKEFCEIPIHIDDDIRYTYPNCIISFIYNSLYRMLYETKNINATYIPLLQTVYRIINGFKGRSNKKLYIEKEFDFTIQDIIILSKKKTKEHWDTIYERHYQSFLNTSVDSFSI